MSSPQAVYPVVRAWVTAVVGPGHALAHTALAQLLTALLVSQRLTASALMRALVSAPTVPARQRYKRVARALARPWLTPAFLTPRLVRAACALAPTPVPHLALDSVRLGRWEVFTIGLVWHTRILPVGWAVLPYPWPKGTFTPTVCALIEQVAAAWPAEAPRPHLLADRGFPSRRLFATLTAVGWAFTIRLRASDGVVADGPRQTVRQLLATASAGTWQQCVATYGAGRDAVAATLVIGRGLPVLAWHQRDDGTARQRAHQQRRHAHHLVGKRGRRPGRQAPASDRWMVLFSTHATWRSAVQSYRRRWATEGSYRDAQSGWDGRQGWDLDGAVRGQRDADAVARLVGVWALGMLLHSALGDALAGSHDPPVRDYLAAQTTSGRLSVWARAHLALTDPHAQLQPWLLAQLATIATHLTAVDPLPATVLPFAPRPSPPPRASAA